MEKFGVLMYRLRASDDQRPILRTSCSGSPSLVTASEAAPMRKEWDL